MKNQISQLVALQYQLNTQINPEWIDKAITEEYDYRTAASQEIAEAMESLGYAWWTKRPLDMQNVFTELVDAMHFLLSLNISQVDDFCANQKEVCELLGARIEKRFTQAEGVPLTNIVNVRKAIRELQSQINTGEMGNIWIAFFKVTAALNFEVSHIFARYVAKNRLNVFRQDNGYRTGNYSKIWLDGRDDGTHVAEYVDSLTEKGEDYEPVEFEKWLTATYKAQITPTTTAAPKITTTTAQPTQAPKVTTESPAVKVQVQNQTPAPQSNHRQNKK